MTLKLQQNRNFNSTFQNDSNHINFTTSKRQTNLSIKTYLNLFKKIHSQHSCSIIIKQK